MQIWWQAASLSLLTTLGATSGALAQSVDAARAARDRAKADLIRAQQAFDRADEAYINALGVASAKVPPSPLPAASQPALTQTGSRSRVVTFSMSGPLSQEINPLDYRGRLITDGQTGAWTQHTSGAKEIVLLEARSLAYELQHNAGGDALRPEWKTICKGDLALKDTTIIDVNVAKQIACNVR